MTSPYDDDPRNGFPTGPELPRIGRELVGLLLMIVGFVALLWVLATVDWRLPVAVGGATAIALGVYLGRGDGAPDVEGS